MSAVSQSISRRTFLGATASAVAIPSLISSRAFGRFAPSNRINVAVIGNGNQCEVDMPAFLEKEDVQVMAVCDVNTASGGYRTEKQFLGRKVFQQKVNEYYAKSAPSGGYKGCDAYSDFREVLARKDIDAVAVIVPDHWHAIITILAAKAGKDIYCEKPLSLCIGQGQAMVRAVRKYNRVLQTGSHWRSHIGNRFMCELVRNGRIGKLKRITSSIPVNNAESPAPGWKPMPVPEGFDYPFWLGPAPDAPYHQDRCFYRFRFILDYSGGQVTNFGAHSLDIAQWANGTCKTGPVEIEPIESQWPPKGSLFTTSLFAHFVCRYANGVEIVCKTDKDKGFYVEIEGSEGRLEFGYKGLKTFPESLKTSKIGPNEIHLPESVPGRTEQTSKFLVPDQVRNFIDCVKSRKDPIAAVEIGHRTASLCHLGNTAMRLNRKLKWDPEKEIFPGDDEANKMLHRPMREPWQLPEV